MSSLLVPPQPQRVINADCSLHRKGKHAQVREGELKQEKEVAVQRGHVQMARTTSEINRFTVYFSVFLLKTRRTFTF